MWSRDRRNACGASAISPWSVSQCRGRWLTCLSCQASEASRCSASWRPEPAGLRSFRHARKLLRNDSAGLSPAKEIDIFFEEFMDYYPDTTVFYLHDAYLTFAPSTSDSRIVAKYLALKYGLLIYDPQTGIVLNESSDSLTQKAMEIISLF